MGWRETLTQLIAAELEARRAHNSLVALANAGLAEHEDIAVWDAMRGQLFALEMAVYAHIDAKLGSIVDDPVGGAAVGGVISGLRRQIPEPELLPEVRLDIPTQQRPLPATQNVAWAYIVLALLAAVLLAISIWAVWDIGTDIADIIRLRDAARLNRERWDRVLRVYQECLAAGRGTPTECATAAKRAVPPPDFPEPTEPPGGSSATYLLLGAGAMAVLGFLVLLKRDY